uniref:SGNH domain-containing protein n=1 Tax=Panagrolaimus davidi TaxID=227884 RepID=A0A914Q466_9BILA
MGGAIPCSYTEKNTIHFGKRKAYYCEVAGINPNGTLIGLSFGNSFSMNIITAVASNQLFKKVINLFISGSEFPGHDDFEEYLMEKMIKPIKPDPPSPNLEAWLAALKCPKCEFFDYREAFCDGEFCNVLDLATGLPLYRDASHISPLGIRRIKPLIDKAIYKALKICV